MEFGLKGQRLHGRWMLIKTQRGHGNKAQWLLMKLRDEYATSDGDPPQFIEPELAELAKKPPEGRRWIHEAKFDGYRTQARIDRGKVRLHTRSGLDWTEKYPHLARGLQEIAVDNAILDGEVVWLDPEGRSDFQKLQAALKEKQMNRVVYYVFDLLFLNGEDCRDKPLRERKERLKKLLTQVKTPGFATVTMSRDLRRTCSKRLVRSILRA